MEAAKKHENFEVAEVINLKRKKVIRQDRLDVDDIDFQIFINGIYYKVLNVAPFGLAVSGDSSLESLNEIPNVSVLINGIEIAEVHLKVVRKSGIERDLSVAFEILGEPI